MTESQLWQKLRPHFFALGGDATRHEDLLSTGVPDVSFCLLPTRQGWIELKCYDSVPNGLTKHKLGLTLEQVHWLQRRGKAGSLCCVVARVGGRLLLWWWDVLEVSAAQDLLECISYEATSEKDLVRYLFTGVE